MSYHLNARFRHGVQNSNAPVICNHCPPLTGNSGDNDFSSITALYCGDLLRVIALLFIRVNSTGYIYVISQARHSPGTAGELKRSLPRTLAPLSPAHPSRWGGGGTGTNDWCIKGSVRCLIFLGGQWQAARFVFCRDLQPRSILPERPLRWSYRLSPLSPGRCKKPESLLLLLPDYYHLHSLLVRS